MDDLDVGEDVEDETLQIHRHQQALHQAEQDHDLLLGQRSLEHDKDAPQKPSVYPLPDFWREESLAKRFGGIRFGEGGGQNPKTQISGKSYAPPPQRRSSDVGTWSFNFEPQGGKQPHLSEVDEDEGAVDGGDEGEAVEGAGDGGVGGEAPEGLRVICREDDSDEGDGNADHRCLRHDHLHQLDVASGD